MANPFLTKSEIAPADVDTLAATGKLWAVVDACDEPEVVVKAAELGDASVCLYRAEPDDVLLDIAPYLMRADPPLVEWIRERVWSRPWGIFAVSDNGLDALRRHFREFLIVAAPDGSQMYFRFYDPRVLDTLLPTCQPAELRILFGVVQGYVTAATSGETLTLWKSTRLPAVKA